MYFRGLKPYAKLLADSTMASVEHEPIMGVLGLCPQWGPGAKPLVRGRSVHCVHWLKRTHARVRPGVQLLKRTHACVRAFIS